MTTFTRFRCVATGAVLVVAAAGAMAPPALAAAPTVTITQPGDRQVLTVSSFPVSAVVNMQDGKIVGDIRLALRPSTDGSQQAPVNLAKPANGTSSQNVSFDVTIEYNGQYEAVVSATGEDSGLLQTGVQPERKTFTTPRRNFSVAAPPAPPTAVRSVVDKESRAVTLSWNPNTEKDMLFYLVQRARGDGAYLPLGKTNGPDTSIIDPSTAEAGGEYRYQVVAVRRGAVTDEGVTSVPSRAATVSVPGPPGSGAGGSTGAGGGTGTGAGDGSTAAGSTPAPNSPGALKTSGTLDLSGFSAIKSRASRSGARSQEPDPGFRQTLPFGSTTDTTRLVGQDEQGPGPQGDDPEVRELGAEESSNARQQSAGFLAAGLLATVLLMHLLWIRGEVQREPLESLVPE